MAKTVEIEVPVSKKDRRKLESELTKGKKNRKTLKRIDKLVTRIEKVATKLYTVSQRLQVLREQYQEKKAA
jgi:division protein CdvB (Snf7/Vps24/ESCRT-III family)